jgi:hypothetical protein
VEIKRVRSRFDQRVAVIHPHDDVSMCQKHFQDECNINNILKKYRKTGIIDHVTKARLVYGDFNQYKDAAQNLDKVAKAQQLFEQLPAELRNEFKNSIPGFFDYISQAKNFDQCVAWGIFDKPAPAPEVEAAPVEPQTVVAKASTKSAKPASENV